MIPPKVVQMEEVSVRGANENHDVRQNAPASHVINRSTGNGHGSQPALKHVALTQYASQHRECRDTHGGAHE